MKNMHISLAGWISAVQSADSGSFSAAAKVLDLTPAAISKSVGQLETGLKVRLFNRTTRQLSLTEEGRRLIEQARIGISALQTANELAGDKGEPEGLVRLSCSVGFGRRFILPLLPAFNDLYPKVPVELSMSDHLVDLVKDGFDIGIRGGSEPPEGMVARKICSLNTVLVATPRYLKRKGTPKHFTELAEHDLLRVKFLNGRLLPWVFKDKGKLVNIEYQAKLLISDPEVILDAALMHMGIAGIGRHHAATPLKRGDLIEVLQGQRVSPETSMSIFYPHRAGIAPRVRVMVDFLLKHFARDTLLHSQ